MNYQALFSLKNTKKVKMLPAAVVISTLRVRVNMVDNYGSTGEKAGTINRIIDR